MSEPQLRTPLYERHVEAGARMVPFAGFDMPVLYGSIVGEHRAVRTISATEISWNALRVNSLRAARRIPWKVRALRS